jgi:FkbM family methyltransferase
MIVDTSEPIGRTLAASGIWEPGVTALFHRLLVPGDVCVDVGANVGYFTLLASGLVGPAGHVYALEPAPVPYKGLLANLALNRVANVTALPVAAGAAEGDAELHTGPRGKAGESSIRQPTEGWSTVHVMVRPLPALLETAEVERLRLIKLDVEGFEVEVLRGLAPIFEQGFRPALIAEVHPLLDPEALAYVADLARRHDLVVHRLLDDPGSHRDVPVRAPLPFIRVTANDLVSLSDSHPSLLLTSRDPARGRSAPF